MAREGWTLHTADLVVLSPYRRENVLRFGDYTIDQLHVPPPAYNPLLHATTEGNNRRDSRKNGNETVNHSSSRF